MVSLVIGCGGDESDEAERSPSRCEQLREHLISIQLADASQIDMSAHRDAMRRALGSGFITSCESTMSEPQVKCALDAADAQALTACTR